MHSSDEGMHSETKTCPDCGEVKPRSQYGRNRSRPDGLSFYCSSCFRRRNNALYRARREASGSVFRDRYDGPPDHKRCSACREVKPLSEFHRARSQSGGYATYCKPCRAVRQRAAHLKSKYGMTLTDYEAMVQAQGGLCACCGERPPEHVDHDHVTGVVRGVVCFPCNAAIGHFEDRVQLMRNAIDYLERTTWQRHKSAPGVFRLTSPRPAAAASPSSSALQLLISSRRG